MAIIDVSKLVPLAEIDKLKDRIASISKEKDTITTSIEAESKKSKVIEDELSDLLGEKGKLSKIITDGESTIKSIEKSLDSYADELAKIEIRIEAENTSIAETETKIADAKASLEPAEKEFEAKAKEIDALRAENKEIPKELLEQYIAAEAEVSLIRGNISIYQGFIDKSKQTISDLEKSKKIIEADRAQTEDKKSLTEVSIAEATDNLSDVETNISDTEVQLKEIKADIEKQNTSLTKVSKDLEANEKELAEKEDTRTGWNVSFEATALENYVEDLGTLSQEAKDQLGAKQVFNAEIATQLGIRGTDENAKLTTTLSEIKETVELKDAVHTLSATAAKVMSDMQNYTMASLVDKIKAAAMKGLVQIKLETTLTKGVINALFEAGYDIHFESENNKYITIINWAHPNMTNPAGPN